MLNIIKLIMVKTLSLGGIVSIFIYLYFLNGFDLIGEYSGLTAILAPLVTFSLYRYLESLNIQSGDKKNYLENVIMPTTIITFLLGVVFFYIINFIFGIFNVYLFLIFCLSKFLDLIFEIILGYLSSEKEYGHIIKQNFLRILFFWILVIVSYFLNFDFDLKSALILYIISQIPIFVYEVFRFKLKFNYIIVRKYFVENFKFGTLNTILSFNSIVPRYMIMYFGDYKSLGVYTILHLFASNFVNIAQHPLSVYCLKINDIIKSNIKFMIALPMLLISIVGVFLSNSNQNIFLLILFFLLVLFSFILRSVFVTISIVRHVNLNYYMFISIISTIPFMYFLNFFLDLKNYIFFGCCYIMLSNFILVSLGSREVGKYND